LWLRGWLKKATLFHKIGGGGEERGKRGNLEGAITKGVWESQMDFFVL
jgi:hypothetical protein